MSEKLTISRRGYPPVARAANALIGLGTRVGLVDTTISVGRVVDAARARTGLTDWGDDWFLEGLEKVVTDPGAEHFTPLSRVLMREVWVKAVAQRLKLQALLKAHPEIHDVEVKRPVFILGFPRTGTTVIQQLLALDSSRRGLPFWELITPMPVSKNRRIDRLRREWLARAILVPNYLIAPEQRDLHDIRYDTLEECWYLFCHTFAVLNWDIMTGMQAYGRWLLSFDMRPAYEEYKTWLKVLLWHRPADQLLLKCPEHLWFLDALLATFPDAAIVWTHRDPVKSVASYSSMMSLTRRLVYGTFEPAEIGPFVVDRFDQGVRRAMAARDAWANEANFFDVDFARTVAEPEAVVEELCEHFAIALQPDFRRQVTAWRGHERSDKLGAHRYSAEAYNIDAEVVRRKFSSYIERFGL